MEDHYGIDMALGWYSDSGASSATSTGDVNTEVYAKLSFRNNDIRAVYVDWDDGVSNKKTEANYQWVTSDEPISDVVVSHTYTASGAFNPVVQTVNSAGFVSKYYSKDSSNTDVSPFVQLTTVSGVTISDTKATGIMRVENTTVKSGINNSIFQKEGPKLIYAICAPTLTSTEMGYAGTIKLELEMEIATSTTHKAALTGGKVSSGFSTVIKKQTVPLGTPASKTGLESFIGVGESVNRVLSIKYLNPKLTGDDANDYTKNAALNNLKIFIVAIGDDGLIYPITYVTAGSPIKKAEDRDRFITMDFSQSRAAASNVDPNYYFYDNGNGWFSVDRWTESSSKFTNTTRQTNSTKQVNYTYSPRPDGIGGYANTGATGKFTRPFGTGATDSNAKWIYESAQAERTNQFAVDDFGRFYDTYHLVRNSMEPSSSASNVSSISGNKVTIARITPIINFTASASESGTKFDITGTSTVFTADYTTAAFDNVASNSGKVSLSGCNTQVFQDGASSAADRNANEYLIALWDAKTNKIFFQCTPWWSGSADRVAGTNISDGIRGLKIAGVSYLRAENYQEVTQNLEWKPLKFEDTTASTIEYRDATGDDDYVSVSNSFTKSGFVSFDMPSDWQAVKMEDLYGGTMYTGSSASDNYNPINNANKATDVSGSYTTVKFLATCSALSTAHTIYGKCLTLTGAAVETAMDAIGQENVGAFKYMAEIVTDTGSDIDGQNMWVAKITGDGPEDYTDGYNKSGKELFLQFGTGTGSHYTQPSVNDVYNVIVKRINFYDVLPGNSKVKNIGAAEMLPVDAGVAAKFPNKYGFNDYTAGAGLGLKNAWSGSAKYPLLITLSGNTADVGTTDRTSPEIWNVLDATEGHVAVIKEIDDSAYSLNSLAITSDISIGRSANYFRAITRKGKTFIVKTGVNLSTVGFTSVALGDESSATAFDDHGPSTLYGHLHKARKLQAESVDVYWDEKQKDGTYVRFWGVITDVTETRGTGGPRAIVNFSFNMAIKDIALIDTAGNLMTDRYPLGGIANERDYT